MNADFTKLFISCDTESATIVKQPTQYIMEAGPRVGETASIILRCGAEGWPTPTYQWYKVCKASTLPFLLFYHFFFPLLIIISQYVSFFL